MSDQPYSKGFKPFNTDVKTNLTLALKLKPIIEEKARENLTLSKGRGVKGSQNSAKVIDTREILAKQLQG